MHHLYEDQVIQWWIEGRQLVLLPDELKKLLHHGSSRGILIQYCYVLFNLLSCKQVLRIFLNIKHLSTHTNLFTNIKRKAL